MKLKNSNGDITKKLKLWSNSRTKIVTKLKNSNCDNTNSEREKKLTQNVRTQIVTNSRTQMMTKT